ncbi:MAG TPA: flagellar motor protein MotB [Symbiobacteriaceae bacterium]|jgi:chemotaxis protein MotB
MARRRKSGDHGGGGGGGHGGASGRWLVSYSDFITLMFVVFTVLFSMARLDLSKFDQVAKSFRSAMGPAGPDLAPFQAEAQAGHPKGVTPPDRPGMALNVPSDLIDPSITTSLKRFSREATEPAKEGEPTPKPTNQPTGTAKPSVPTPTPAPTPLDRAKKAFESAPGQIASIRLSDLGLELTYEGRVFFDVGTATLKPDAFSELDGVAAKLKAAGVVQPIIVNCVGDEKPPESSGFTVTGLALARAGAVTDHLRSLPGVDKLTFKPGALIGPEGSTGKPSFAVTILVLRNTQ